MAPSHSFTLVSSLLLAATSSAVSFQSAPSPNLDLSQLGRVALAGNFDAVSLYDYIGQSQNTFSPNGSQSVLAQYPNGAFANLLTSDAAIQTMCTFTMTNGSLIGVVVGGNFTSLAGTEIQAAALVNPDTQAVTALTGLTGQVSSVLCDNERQTVYFGGMFTGANSTNAIAWTTGWANLPFAGFNGPVNAIAKTSNGNIVFGGSFTGMASSPTLQRPDAQAINLLSANISSYPNNTNPQFANPTNIVCKTGAQTGSTSAWTMSDNAPGFWRADFGFGFNPTKLRLYQSQVPDYGTKTWRFTAYPINGIMNFTYFDAEGQLQSCTSQCPLPQGNNTAQDFHFVNEVGMNSFRIDVSAWYGRGGGFGGIELFQNDVYSYAVNDYNEPICDDVSKVGSNSSVKGNWTQIAVPGTTSQYLSTYLPQGTNGTSAGSLPSIVFMPDIKQSGNYSIAVFTPGCVEDNTCSTRGRVTVTGQLTSGNSTATRASQPLPAELYQNQNNEKYDTIYHGYIDAVSDGFRPTVTLTPSPGQDQPLTVVAERVQFILTASTGGLNALYEYNPGQAEISNDFNTSAINMAGASLDEGAKVNQLAVVGDDVYVAGQFSTGSFSNIMVIRDGKAASLPNGGLDQAVQTIYQNGSSLFVGGNFSSTQDKQVTGLNSLAIFSTSDNSWSPMGAGVDGPVTNIVPITLQVNGSQVSGLSVSGYFNNIRAFAGSPAVGVRNLAVWIPSQRQWLQNLGSGIALSGRINAQTNIPGSQTLYAGNVFSQSNMADGVIGLNSHNNNLSLQSLPINFLPQQTNSSSLAKRVASSQGDIDGVVIGLFYTENNQNITILGGRFTANGSDGSIVRNLAFINGSDNNRVSGFTSNASSTAAILALDTQGSTLWAGGSIDGGLYLYDLVNNTEPDVPPALSGYSATVNAIAARPSSPAVFVGGSFATAGALDCNGLCIYDTGIKQWASVPATTGGLVGDSVVNQLLWASNNRLIVAGNLTIGSNTSAFASYDATAQMYHTYPGSGDSANIPGPVTAFTAIDQTYTSFFVAGTASNGTSFISRFTPGNGNSATNPQGTWTTVSSSLSPQSVIESIQVMSLTQNHGQTALLDTDQTLLVTGQLNIPSYGNASAALFNGTAFVPFVQATLADGTPGSISHAFVQNPGNFFVRNEHHLALGLVVLIGLAIALGLIFLIVLVGIIAERIRRRREGYVRAPTYQPAAYEKTGGNVGGIGPHQLFSGIGESGAPRI